MRVADGAIAGNGQFAAEVEQVVLDFDQARSDVRGQRFREQYAEHRVEFVDGADGFDARRVLRHARAVAEAGGPGIAGAGHDFGEAVAHWDTQSRCAE